MDIREFTIRAVTMDGRVHVITRDQIEASIKAAGHANVAAGIQQLEFVIRRALNPPTPAPTPEPEPEQERVAA